ncbi:hypothetical protein GCM10025771_04090 [Niveibacterium umoris]|uniref:PEP-CTERM protein-sorting domain-containing protein n=1 Tax=Niveibacterium umoris TaxID=1193620 RepID=A0A840BLC1_9RHOO|nr:PEP-CTERM sorting domain-containing protein [Niveibacterium umoris]MBB4014045.1 hypothetical protein [Niveibacterium umoris]
MKKAILSLALTFLASAALADTPASLVTNGGFEAGSTGWTARAEGIADGFSIRANGFDFDGTTFLAAPEGTHWASLFCVGYGACGLGQEFGTTIDQKLSTVAGANYSLTFSLGAGIWGATGVDVYWNGAKLLDNASGFSGWKTFSVSGLKGTGSDTLSFGTNADGYGYAYLDAVKVTAAVPEPETYAMFAAGLLFVGALARGRNS